MMSISGIQGLPLEVTVVGCYNLKDTEWISRQDPYVCVEYGSTRYRTKTCTDGGKNPIFQEKFVFPLIEGLRELNIVVWNSNTLSAHDFIGSGRIQLHKALSQGFDDTAWPLMSKSGRHSGEVRLILHYSSANNNQSKSNFAPKASQYETSSASLNQVLPHSSSTQAPSSPYLPTTAYSALPPNYTAYPPPPAGYPPLSYPSITPAGYPPAGYPPVGYPPQTCSSVPPVYPTQPYPPPPQFPTSYYPPGPPSGIYPPPPY